jgi:hypothetical protein
MGLVSEPSFARGYDTGSACQADGLHSLDHGPGFTQMYILNAGDGCFETNSLGRCPSQCQLTQCYPELVYENTCYLLPGLIRFLRTGFRAGLGIAWNIAPGLIRKNLVRPPKIACASEKAFAASLTICLFQICFLELAFDLDLRFFGTAIALEYKC